MRSLPNPSYLVTPKFRPIAEEIDDQARIEALDSFLPEFHRNYARWVKTPRPDFEAQVQRGGQTLRTLQSDGCVLLKIPAQAKAGLKAITEPLLADLEDAAGKIEAPKFRDTARAVSIKESPELYSTFEAILRDLNVMEVAGAYARRPLRIKKLFVQTTDARITRSRYGEIGSEGLPSVRSSYWHIDSDIWPCVKALVYLTDVDLDQGPMRYVLGSHRQLGEFEAVVRKTNDGLKLPTKQFLALPDEFRMHALFGDHLDADDPEIQPLLQRERVLCDPEGGDFILFDNNGVHRGGFVRNGARRILQCLFEAA
jgi:hypothetical protein